MYIKQYQCTAMLLTSDRKLIKNSAIPISFQFPIQYWMPYRTDQEDSQRKNLFIAVDLIKGIKLKSCCGAAAVKLFPTTPVSCHFLKDRLLTWNRLEIPEKNTKVNSKCQTYAVVNSFHSSFILSSTARISSFRRGHSKTRNYAHLILVLGRLRSKFSLKTYVIVWSEDCPVFRYNIIFMKLKK
jgi:hypothetical protein